MVRRPAEHLVATRTNPVSVRGHTPQSPFAALNQRMAGEWCSCSSSASATSTFTSSRKRALRRIVLLGILHHLGGKNRTAPGEHGEAVTRAPHGSGLRRARMSPPDQLADSSSQRHALGGGILRRELIHLVIKRDTGSHVYIMHQSSD